MNQNLEAWNQRLEYHLKSDFYGMESFLAGRDTLPEHDRLLLGDVNGKRLLHLQCHFGQDSLSLARTGALVTGVDFSEPAIAKARELNLQLGLDADFVCCDVRETLQHVRTSFDIVYTSYGTIGWLPELESWAQVIAGALKPGGRLVFVEFHPVVWMFDNDLRTIRYAYHNDGPITEEENGSYADADAPVTTTTTTWNHSLSEVVGALLRAGMELQQFEEYNFSPYPIFKDMIEYQPGRFQIRAYQHRLPMVYALVARKR